MTHCRYSVEQFAKTLVALVVLFLANVESSTDQFSNGSPSAKSSSPELYNAYPFRKLTSPFRRRNRPHDPMLLESLSSYDPMDAKAAMQASSFLPKIPRKMVIDESETNNEAESQNDEDDWRSNQRQQQQQEDDAFSYNADSSFHEPLESDERFGGNNNVNNDEEILLQSPLVYRYYARRRARAPASGSVPFIFMSKNVDHCKNTAQELASLGFSVIACERLPPQDGSELKQLETEESAALINELLNALRWNKAVIVGFDSEAVFAIQVAMKLAPNRIAGLMLCGNLQEASHFVAGFEPSGRKPAGAFEIDRFLESDVDCPFAIVWDGEDNARVTDSESVVTPEVLKRTRYLVLGGGSAPHRRRPELVAWCMIRFVEKHIASNVILQAASRSRGGQQHKPNNTQQPTRSKKAYSNMGNQLREFFSPGSFIVSGRVIATSIFYIVLAKIFVHQYYNVHDGVDILNSKLKIIATLPKRTKNLIHSITTGFVSLFVFIKRGDASNMESKMESIVTNDDLDDLEKEVEESVDNDSVDHESQLPFEPPPVPNFQPTFFLDHVVA